MNLRSKIITLALGHGLNDLIAGFFLGSYAIQNNNLLQAGIIITAYNVLAFGGQYLVALLLERFQNIKKLILLSYLLNVIAVFIFLFTPVSAIVLAGIASAIYHVAGGSYCATHNKAINIGLFAAPGVAGLVAGGALAWKQYDVIPFLIPISIVFLFILLGINFEKQIDEQRITGDINPDHHLLNSHDLIMILLLMIISLRSATWNIFQLIYENNFEWLIAIAITAAIGKIAGGWLADKIGWRLYALSSTIVATPLLTVFKKEYILFCLGIGVLQSGIPATTSLIIQSLNGKTALGISLAFGIAVIIGSFVNVFPTQQLLLQMPILLFASILLLIVCLFSGKRITKLRT